MAEKCGVNVQDCPLTPRVEALERANEQHGNTHRDMYDRLRDLERLEGIQGEQYKNILGKLDTLTKQQEELRQKLDELEAKPGKRWDKLAETVLVLIATAVVAYLLGKVGL